MTISTEFAEFKRDLAAHPNPPVRIIENHVYTYIEVGKTTKVAMADLRGEFQSYGAVRMKTSGPALKL